MTPKSIFEETIAGRLASPEGQASAKEIDAIYQFHITGDGGGDWVVNLRDCEVTTGSNDDADCTITLADSDFVGLLDGSIAPPTLFMTGKLQIAGNMGLAMKLTQVLKA